MSMIKKNTLLGSIKDELMHVNEISEVKVIRNIDKNINDNEDWIISKKPLTMRIKTF